MSLRTLEQGITAVQSGNLEEGARLIRIALKDETIAPAIRASGLMWLAETSTDNQFKIDCYRQANAADPANQEINRRLGILMSSQLPPQVSGNTPTQGLPATNYPPAQGTPYQTGTHPAVTPQPAPGSLPPQGATPIAPYPPYHPQQPTGNTPVQPAPAFQTGQMPAAPTQMPGMPQPPYQTQAAPAAIPGQPQAQRYVIPTIQRTVGIFGGPNGRGTGFFVTREGLIATTRFVVGGETDIEIELQGGQRIGGKVVRCYPQYDLGLIQANAAVAGLLTVSQMPVLSDNAPIAVFAHGIADPLRSTRRETRHQTATYWFPTLINRLLDAGGNPVFDAQNMLAGMMTRNASRANGYMYGLHITLIYKLVEQYHQELQQLAGQGSYCRHCGSSSRAGAFGGYYCETCGSVLPASLEITRHPLPNVGALYGENLNRPCPHCRATVGYYNGQCLRCGQDVTGKV